MTKGLIVAAGVAASCVWLAVGLGGAAAGGTESRIEPRVLLDTAGGRRRAPFVVRLRSQADLTGAYRIKNEDARGWYVYRALRRTAARTQRPIQALLASRGASFRSFWAANVIVASGDRSLVEDLAARPDVAAIESNRSSGRLPNEERSSDTARLPQTVEPGVSQVHAPDLWALGYTGQDIVVANQDTGIRWTHDALTPHYRGWNGSAADHNYNWWDAIHSGGGSCAPNHQEPCDDNGHGTHTTGTAIGDDGGGNQIGVAPGAKWIGCRNMDQGNGTPASYIECFQFFLAPTDLSGQNADPTRRPHVESNSWHCPPSQGCAAETLQQIVENSEAAGIFVEASADSYGPGCSTLADPPAIYAASFTTGAINGSTTALASFSSRGPVAIDGSNRIKPDIVAPGVNVRSSVSGSDSAYSSLSGTAMAGPHVVGVVALLWSAIPSLSRDIAATKELLASTADPNVIVTNGTQCGGIDHVPNNHFGWGLVDALAAYNGGPPPPPPPPPPRRFRHLRRHLRRRLRRRPYRRLRLRRRHPRSYRCIVPRVIG